MIFLHSMSLRPSNSKKIVAAFLMSIFLFIYAEKTFHRHQDSPATSHEHAALIKSVNAGCSICEFQVTKDAYLVSLPPYVVAYTVVNKNYISFSTNLPFTTSRHLADRGPPVLL